jgi:hypothetical protein
MGFLNRFGAKRDDNRSERQRFYKEWERQRSMAISPSDLAEIDAIFARGDRDWS